MKRTRMTEDQIHAAQQEARRRMKVGTSSAATAAKERSERLEVNKDEGNAHYGEAFKTVKGENGHVQHVYGDGEKVDMGKPKDAFVAGQEGPPPKPPVPPAPQDATGQRPQVGSGGMRLMPKIPGVTVSVSANDGGAEAPSEPPAELASLVKAMKARKRG